MERSIADENTTNLGKEGFAGRQKQLIMRSRKDKQTDSTQQRTRCHLQNCRKETEKYDGLLQEQKKLKGNANRTAQGTYAEMPIPIPRVQLSVGIKV